MKRIKAFTMIAAAAAVFSFTSEAYAGPKPWVWSWWGSHWEGLDFVPYQNGKHPHNTQWEKRGWQPEYWAVQRESGIEVVRGFYFADIVRGQYVKDEIPVLEVGPGFYNLGGEDQRRVVAMVDDVYGITNAKEFGMFNLVDWETKEPIGAYTRYGLQLQ